MLQLQMWNLMSGFQYSTRLGSVQTSDLRRIVETALGKPWKYISRHFVETDTNWKTLLSNYRYKNVAETLLGQLWRSYSFIFILWPIEDSYVAFAYLCNTVRYPTIVPCHCDLCSDSRTKMKGKEHSSLFFHKFGLITIKSSSSLFLGNIRFRVVFQ